MEPSDRKLEIEFSYDNDSDNISISFVGTDRGRIQVKKEFWPVDLHNNIGLLFDESDKFLGLKILSASKYLRKYLLQTKTY